MKIATTVAVFVVPRDPFKPTEGNSSLSGIARLTDAILRTLAIELNFELNDALIVSSLLSSKLSSVAIESIIGFNKSLIVMRYFEDSPNLVTPALPNFGESSILRCPNRRAQN